jgi:hypothetical protein
MAYIVGDSSKLSLALESTPAASQERLALLGCYSDLLYLHLLY